MPRSTPAAGSMTYGMYRSPRLLVQVRQVLPDRSWWVVRSKSVRFAMPSSSPHSEPTKSKRYSMSTVRLE